ncbi:hypothetical protein DKX38_029675 [Salix brachista]|uniref:Uncharacterized protein n=1 Tax=Salix brachista TaxID=2182728 RepID=A0A5N5JC17_9ROSI|nr:hypothetical protein DKX38_029675 [Salix brachista]
MQSKRLPMVNQVRRGSFSQGSWIGEMQQASDKSVIISEILDPRTKNLLCTSKISDYVLSNELVSMALAMVAEDQQINDVLEELFAEVGNELQIRQADLYLSEGEELSFYEVLLRARQRRDIVIGVTVQLMLKRGVEEAFDDGQSAELQRRFDGCSQSSRMELGQSELESEFIEKIVGDVLNKLHGMSSSHTTDLFGIDVRVNKVESLLNIESQDVIIVGIWGMGGIGKTTIAEAVCNKVRSRFEGIFVANFRQQLKTGSMADLQRSFLSQVLCQEILNMGYLNFRDTFMRDRLRRKKVFIVMDDVDDSMPLEEWKELLHGPHRSFGPGSKVLMTSRDKQMLTNVVDEIYEVEGLSYGEAFQLFTAKALKNCISTIDQRDLIEKIASRVQGNPLALIVLGSSLYGKSSEEWYSALNKLAQNPRIENALRISYDVLDKEQQSIFLDITHFFIGATQKQAIRILDGFYRWSVIFDINTLIDKCLVTTSHNMLEIHDRLEIHDLLQEMAFNIVRAESKFPGKRSRLCHLPDVVHVMEENKGTEEIEGISLDISKLSKQIQLKHDAFARMDGLRFLKFYSSNFSENKDKLLLPPTCLEYLSNKLIYFHWETFPLKSLPQSFCAEHLFELNLSYSKVEKLWTGVQDIGNLRNFVLSYSPYLIELPDLSKATNLVCLNLVSCYSLTEVPSSLQHLDKLEEIDLSFCYDLKSFPMLDSKVLRVLRISRCLDISKCPTISQNMERLELNETSLKEVPQSVISKLEHLSLRGCSKITKFPEISGDIKTLYLDETAITEVPSSI